VVTGLRVTGDDGEAVRAVRARVARHLVGREVELDLLLSRGPELRLLEVKARRPGAWVGADTALEPEQRLRLQQALRTWLDRVPWPGQVSFQRVSWSGWGWMMGRAREQSLHQARMCAACAPCDIAPLCFMSVASESSPRRGVRAARRRMEGLCPQRFTCCWPPPHSSISTRAFRSGRVQRPRG